MMLRNLATALIEHGRIETTLAKAKEVQPFVEKIITLAKDGWDLNRFRRVLAVLTSKKVAFDLFHEIGPRFKGRSGGYTRIYKLGPQRISDAAELALIEFVKADDPGYKKSKGRKPGAAKKSGKKAAAKADAAPAAEAAEKPSEAPEDKKA
jgi:large subunit ribosomal protein L17